MANQAHDSVVLRVLTQRPLLQRVCSFMDGLPYLVGAFAASIVGSDGEKLPNFRGKLPHFAVRRRNLEMLQLLHHARQHSQYSNLPELDFFNVASCAVEYNALKILQWLSDEGITMQTNRSPLLVIAITNYFDNPRIMDWAEANYPGARLSIQLQDVCSAAAIGNINAIQWLHERECNVFSPIVMDTAATHGHLNIVQFLHANRREGFTPRGIHGAALHGYADVVEFLIQTGKEKPWDHTLQMAATAGHLQVVQLLCRASHCGCLFEAHCSAVASKQLEVAAFLKSEMVPNLRKCNLNQHDRSVQRPCQHRDDCSTQPDSGIDALIPDFPAKTRSTRPWWIRWLRWRQS